MSIGKNKRQHAKRKEKRHERLANAHLEGWKKCNEFHYQKIIVGKLVDWWPSTNKCMIDNQVYRVFGESDMLPIIGVKNGTGQ